MKNLKIFHHCHPEPRSWRRTSLALLLLFFSIVAPAQTPVGTITIDGKEVELFYKIKSPAVSTPPLGVGGPISTPPLEVVLDLSIKDAKSGDCFSDKKKVTFTPVGGSGSYEIRYGAFPEVWYSLQNYSLEMGADWNWEVFIKDKVSKKILKVSIQVNNCTQPAIFKTQLENGAVIVPAIIDQENNQVDNTPPVTQNKPLIGVIRWDWWANFSITSDWLAPKKWHHKLPFFAKITGENSVQINGATQQVMDQEIDYAAYAGIDYFAINYYHDYGLSNGSYGYNLFMQSKNPNKTKMKFCYIIEETSVTDGFTFNSSFLKKVCTDMARDDYQKVMNGRPLFYYFSYPLLTYAKSQAIFNTYKAINPGKPLPYLVNMYETDGSEAKQSQGDETAQAHSQYVALPPSEISKSGVYATVAEADRVAWNRYKNAKAKQIPILTTGWHTQPIYESVNKGWYHTSNNNPDLRATKQELINHLKETIDFVNNNPETCEANTILCYAWNEHAEGGFISPTLRPGTSAINTDYIDAFREVLQINQLQK